ncbi:MAG: SDR family NAD(P)-dependent oxidoreductase [Bacteroidales bacterium]|jgi:NAD(P)-dependent dehydrogenase (short-subunit alcohol dehydrogenase family)|nr:SDR family NAD(P)-dependent oxidoreductase [Bacteroidales bacterium]
MKDKKVILVTGASSGIGYDTALALAEHGHRVYAAARRVELMEPLRAKGVEVMRMDVTDEASMSEGVNRLLQAEGRIDVLVNNAGYGYFGAVENVPMDEARRQLEVNVFGLARLCQLVLPAMRRQGSGRIVNTSSIAGRAVFYMGAWYNVTKYAVEALSDALRMETRPFGIDVVLVEPGPIRTDWGLIAARHLKESSADTAYEEQGTRWANAMRWAYEAKFFSGPSVITRAICRAVESRHPRTRYCRGRGAHLTLVLHALLPTRWWDAVMRLGGRLRLGS